MSYPTRMLGLAMQGFLSAAIGIAVSIAAVCGFTRRNVPGRPACSMLYILLPFSLLLASRGVAQNFSSCIWLYRSRRNPCHSGLSVQTAPVGTGPRSGRNFQVESARGTVMIASLIHHFGRNHSFTYGRLNEDIPWHAASIKSSW